MKTVHLSRISLMIYYVLFLYWKMDSFKFQILCFSGIKKGGWGWLHSLHVTLINANESAQRILCKKC